MLIKFLSTKKGNIRRLIDYLTGEKDLKGVPREPLPKVLAGNPKQLRRLVESLDFKVKYQTGVLSFAPGDDPTPEQQKEVMALFERVAFAGLNRNQYDILWVQHSHTQENRCELHFALPCVELSSGKNLNVTWPGSHNTYYKSLRDYLNAKYQWADPDDPARRRDIQPGYHAYIDRQNERLAEANLEGVKRDDIRKRVHMGVEEEIRNEMIFDRDSLVLYLKREGFTFTREGEDYISIMRKDFKRPVRLRGKVYERQWRIDGAIGRTTQEEGDREQGITGEDNQRRIRELQDDLERRIANRAKRFARDYGKVDWDEYYATLADRNLDSDEHWDFLPEPQPVTATIDRRENTNQQIGGDDVGISGRITGILEPIQRRISEGKATATATNEGMAEFFRRINQGTKEINRGEERNYRSLDRIDTGVAEQGRRIGLALQGNRQEIYTAHENVSGLDEAVTRVTEQIRKDKEELEQFTKWINFVDYAGVNGYAVFRDKSTPNGFAMKNKATGDRIFVGRYKDQYFYVSLSDPEDRGTIIDFIRRRSRKTLKEIREELRPWLQRKVTIKERVHALPKLNTTDEDRFFKDMRALALECGIISDPNKPVSKPEVAPQPKRQVEPEPKAPAPDEELELETYAPDFDDELEPEAPSIDDDLEL